MWDPRWLTNRSFWVEAGLFLFVIMLLAIGAVVKPPLPGTYGIPTPTMGPNPLTFYYAETEASTAITKIWQSTTEDITLRKELVVFSYSPDSLLKGNLSPDGSLIALLIRPMGAVDGTHGELWLLKTDGTYFQKGTKGYFSWFAWKQDGQALALFSQDTTDIQSGESIELGSRLSKLNLSTGEMSVILDDSSPDTKPLGWSSGGGEFVMMTLSNTGRWSVNSINVESNTKVARFSLPENDLLRNAWLSPSGAYLLMDIIRNDKASLILYSLDGKQQFEIASQGVGLFSDPTSFSAIWSPDGQRILINQPSTNLTNTTWKTYDLRGGTGIPVFLGDVDPNHFLRPLDWSSNGKWLTMAESPFPYTRLYIKEILAADRYSLPLDKPENRATWLGWSPND